MIPSWWVHGECVVGPWTRHDEFMISPWCFRHVSTVVPPCCFRGDFMVGSPWVRSESVVFR